MAHWKLTLAYNGSYFHGWQVQPGLVTVQGTLRDALQEITGAMILPQGSGRTDAGVHALAQITSFSLPHPIPAANLQRALNRIFPPGLRVLRAETVPSTFHARHSARRKFYEYRIFERRVLTPSGERGEERICSPFLASFVWDCRWPLDVERLDRAAALLVGTRDFSSMAASSRQPRDEDEAMDQSETEPGVPVRRPSRPNPVKTIYNSGWSRAEGLLIYRVCGNGFLHHMVRNLVGTMVDIGRNSLRVEDLEIILAARDRREAGPTAPASGLYLVEVGYEAAP